MFTSYILDKDSLVFLWQICGGDVTLIPSDISTKITSSDYIKISEKLERLGLVHISEQKTDIERTMGFLITSMINSSEISKVNGFLVFYCDKLIIAAKEDRLSKKKCRLIPLMDIEMLKEFLDENICISDDKEVE